MDPSSLGLFFINPYHRLNLHLQFYVLASITYNYGWKMGVLGWAAGQGGLPMGWTISRADSGWVADGLGCWVNLVTPLLPLMPFAVTHIDGSSQIQKRKLRSILDKIKAFATANTKHIRF